MKKLLLISLVFLCFISISVVAKGRSDSLLCLEITGKIHPSSSDDRSACKVELMLNDVVTDSVILKSGKGKFFFDLKKDRHYTIRISRPGHITRHICVRTQIPDKYMDIYDFVFETRLVPSKDAENINRANEKMHLPVARIFFDPRKQCFYYSKVMNNAAGSDLCRGK